ncbi:MAG: hypothetical protein RR623_07245 [Bacilli bacterium]
MDKKRIYKSVYNYIDNLKNNRDRTDFKSVNIYTGTFFALLIYGIYKLLGTINLENIDAIIVNIIISIGLILSAFTIIKYSFDKLLKMSIITLLIIGLYYMLRNYLLLIPIIIAIISYPAYLLKRRQKLVNLRNFNFFEDGALKGANLYIKDIVPIMEFKKFITIKINPDKELNNKEIQTFNDNFSLFCHKNCILFVGFKYDISYSIYLYSTSRNTNLIEKYLDNNINYNYEITKKDDKNFKNYKNDICPDDKSFMHLCNKKIINHRLEEELDTHKEQSLILVLSFRNKNKALQCKTELESSKDFIKIEYEDNAKRVKDNNLKVRFSNMIYIEKRTKIGLERINTITDTIYDYAEKYNGVFEEWVIGELTKEDE